ncbi:MAG: 2-oxoglutarate dehydrogenase E1 component, partial [Acetobacteraceae bacterium]|nr:2-oxoglutarate dehydrogenase E1 component [Acetobacteraceae bacterium]
MAGIDILASAFSGANAAFLGDLYARWATDPGSVDPSFAELFGTLNEDSRAVLEEATGASWAPRPVRPEPVPAPVGDLRAAIIPSLRALMLVRSYRVRGHLEARLDPLGLQVPPPHPELDPATYGFTQADLDRP